MKLFVDDFRDGDGTWLIARTAATAIAALSTCLVNELSLDYDLDGVDLEKNGGHVVDWMVESLIVWPAAIHIHSANDLGRVYMWDMLQKYAPKSTKIDITFEPFGEMMLRDMPSLRPRELEKGAGYLLHWDSDRARRYHEGFLPWNTQEAHLRTWVSDKKDAMASLEDLEDQAFEDALTEEMERRVGA